MKKPNPTDAAALVQADALDQSPSHLLHRVLQIALELYTAEMGENALTQRQFVVLKALDGTQEPEASGLSQSDLVRLTGIDRSTLADMVARMLSKGLLERERSATDARANLVRLSAVGKAALDDMMPRVLSADEKILGLLSPPKRDSFIKLLKRIISAREGGPVPEEPTKEKGANGKPGKLKSEKKKKKDGKGKKGKSSSKTAAKKLRALHMEDPLPYPEVSEGAAVPETPSA